MSGFELFPHYCRLGSDAREMLELRKDYEEAEGHLTTFCSMCKYTACIGHPARLQAQVEEELQRLPNPKLLI